MDKRAAKAIVEASLMIGSMDIEMQEYSGRGMYGDKTTGIVGKIGDLLPCVALAAADLARQELDDYTVDQFVEDISCLRTDSMGRSTIWY